MFCWGLQVYCANICLAWTPLSKVPTVALLIVLNTSLFSQMWIAALWAEISGTLKCECGKEEWCCFAWLFCPHGMEEATCIALHQRLFGSKAVLINAPLEWFPIGSPREIAAYSTAKENRQTNCSFLYVCSPWNN